MNIAPRLPFDDQPPRRRLAGPRRPPLLVGGRAPMARQASYDAAVESEESGSALADRIVLMRLYLRAGLEGLTDAEVERATGWPVNIITARRNDLVHTGDVVAKCERRQSVRFTRKGLPSKLRITVWVAAEAVAREIARQIGGVRPCCAGRDHAPCRGADVVG